jgi:hypothetical protein
MILNEVPENYQNPTADQIAKLVTELNDVWEVSKYSIATHLGYLHGLGFINNKRVYNKDKVRFRHPRYGNLYDYKTTWYITERGKYVLENPEAVLVFVEERGQYERSGRSDRRKGEPLSVAVARYSTK